MTSAPAPSPLRLVAWLNSTSGSLAHRAARGGSWLLIGDAFARAGGLIKIVILARLLAPEDFGLMGIALLALGWVENFTDTGFKSALIQSDGDIRRSFDTFFTVQIVRSVLLAAVLIAAAAPLAAFFNHPEAAALVRVTAFLVLLRGLVSPAAVDLRKKLDFRRETTWRATGVLVGLVVAVPAALLLRNAWALAASVTAAQLTETCVSYILCPYRPHLRVDTARFRELFAFGKWISMANAVAFVGGNIDALFVGRLLGAQGLGFHQVAQQAALLPATQLGSHVHGVMFPAFSQLAHLPERRRAWLRALALLATVAVPLAALATLLAPLFVPLVFGSRWALIVPLVQVLVWAGTAALLTRLMTAALDSCGRPDVPLRGLVLDAAVLLALLATLTGRLGLLGAALAIAAARGSGFVFQTIAACRTVGATPGDLVRAVSLPIFAAAPMLLALPLTFTSLPRAPLLVSAIVVSLGILGAKVRLLLSLYSAPRTAA
jgi:lipopolysaccharide exporter